MTGKSLFHTQGFLQVSLTQDSPKRIIVLVGFVTFWDKKWVSSISNIYLTLEPCFSCVFMD